MTLHPLAQQFASVAGEYERGRPEYPPAVVGAIAAELGVEAGAPVLDLGAGTGKLSRALLAAGYDVIAVEPLDSMRELLAERIGAGHVLAGTAERIAAHMSSMSWIAALPDDRRREVRARIDDLLASGEIPSELPMHYSVGLASPAG